MVDGKTCCFRHSCHVESTYGDFVLVFDLLSFRIVSWSLLEEIEIEFHWFNILGTQRTDGTGNNFGIATLEKECSTIDKSRCNTNKDALLIIRLVVVCTNLLGWSNEETTIFSKFSHGFRLYEHPQNQQKEKSIIFYRKSNAREKCSQNNNKKTKWQW